MTITHPSFYTTQQLAIYIMNYANNKQALLMNFIVSNKDMKVGAKLVNNYELRNFFE